MNLFGMTHHDGENSESDNEEEYEGNSDERKSEYNLVVENLANADKSTENTKALKAGNRSLNEKLENKYLDLKIHNLRLKM